MNADKDRGTQSSALSTQYSALSTRLERALAPSVALLAGMYIVVRPVANQFTPYSAEAAFAGAVVVLLAFCTGFKSLLCERPLCAPDKLTTAVILWVGLFLYGVLRSPNPGVAVPQVCDATIYIVLLLCGYLIARREPPLAGILARVLVAMVVVEAFAAVWQHYVDLPTLWGEVRAQREQLPESLESTSGQFRLFGDEVFGTFGNPNSMAAYLLVGLWLLAGLCWRPAGGQPLRRSKRALGIVLTALMCCALFFTRSKAGGLACLAGAWFFAVQQVSLKAPERGRTLARLTAIGIAVMLAYLLLGMAGEVGVPRSLAVRFEYWKAALGMISAQPLSGMGLGSFADYYPFFKTPLGTETREAHNDYLHLWAELGILGPLLYLGLWALLLRVLRNGEPEMTPRTATVSGRATSVPAAPTPESAALERWAICGGVSGFLVMYCAFNSFNSADVTLLLNGTVNTQTLSAAFHTLALPLIFICVVVGLRPASTAVLSAGVLSTERPRPNERVILSTQYSVLSTPWTHGLRAAIGAVLIHELVDFDFKAQAVIGGLFFVAGLFWALHEPEPAGTDSRPPDSRKLPSGRAGSSASGPAGPTPLGQLSRFLLPALAVPLFVGASWIPMRAGVARTTAEALEDEVRRTARERPPESTAFQRNKGYREKRQEIVRLRAAVVQATPFDGNAWFELAAALDAMQRAYHSDSERDTILGYLAEGERLRPVSPAPKLMYGDFYFRSAISALHRREKAGRDFELARQAYSEAAARYPLAPGLRILEGDAALMQGDTQAAAVQYMQALRADMLIIDTNVCLSSIFTDPRPGAAARHGSDADILARLRPAQETPDLPGLLLRRLVATATLLIEDQRGGAGLPARDARDRAFNAELTRRLKADLLQTGQVLVQGLEELPLRAHVALFHALSFRLVDDAIPAATAQAWEQALKLQDESVRQGQAGTPPYLFYVLDLWYRQGKR